MSTQHCILSYDKAEWNSLITFLFERLFVLVSGTYALLPLPCSLVHLPVLLGKCRVSEVMQCPTNRLRWERLGSVVGTLLPSFLSLPGNRCCLREGPPAACCLNEDQTKTLATRWVTRVSVVFYVIYPLPSFFFLINNGRHAALHFSRAENKGGIETQRKQTVKCGNCSFFLFSSYRSFYQY